MNHTWIIFKKELKDITRDRRTVLTMLVVPLLIWPVMFVIIGVLAVTQSRKVQAKTLKIGLISHQNAPAFRDMLLARTDFSVREDIAEPDIERLIQSDSLDAVVRLSGEFDEQVADLKPGDLHLYFKSSRDMNEARNRLNQVIGTFEDQLLTVRFEQLSLERTIGKAVETHRHDIATVRERFGQGVGGFFPYMLILFCFSGCLYPAIDLGAGEKERRTMETLLVSPASRLQILMGKMGVIALSGLASMVATLAGMGLVLLIIPAVRLRAISTIANTVSPFGVLIFASLILFLVFFFSSTLMAISVFARSFKEAQSQMTPVLLIIFIPAVIGLLPGIRLNAWTALVPVLNVSLATKDIISGTLSPLLLIQTFASLILLAGAGLAFCVRWFNREDVIFRED